MAQKLERECGEPGQSNGPGNSLKMTPERVLRLRRIVEMINDVLIEGTEEAAEAFIAMGLVKRAWEIRRGIRRPGPRNGHYSDLETATTPAPLDC